MMNTGLLQDQIGYANAQHLELFVRCPVGCLHDIALIAGFFRELQAVPDGPQTFFGNEFVAFRHRFVKSDVRKLYWEQSPNVWSKQSDMSLPLVLCLHHSETLNDCM